MRAREHDEAQTFGGSAAVATCNLSRVLKAERIAVGSVMPIKEDWAGRHLKAHIGGRSSHATEALQLDNLT